jgi:dipeptidase
MKLKDLRVHLNTLDIDPEKEVTIRRGKYNAMYSSNLKIKIEEVNKISENLYELPDFDEKGNTEILVIYID